MKAIVTALAAATRATLSLTTAVLALWIGVLLVSRALVLPWEQAFESFLSGAPDARLWLTDWHPRIVDEFFAVERLRVQLGVDLAQRAALPWILAWTFLAGGLVASVATNERERGFWSDCGHYAHRFLWLFVMTAVALASLAFVNALIGGAISTSGWLDPMRDAAWVNAVLVAKTAVMSLAVCLVLFTQRLARVRTVLLGERFAPASWLFTARTVFTKLPLSIFVIVVSSLPLAVTAFGMWKTLPPLLEGGSSGWFVLRTHVWLVPLIGSIVFRTAAEAHLWPLFERVWTRPTAARSSTATVAGVVVACLLIAANGARRDAAHIVTLEVLDDAVSAHHELHLDVLPGVTVETLTFDVDGSTDVIAVSLAEHPLDETTPPSAAPAGTAATLAHSRAGDELTVTLPSALRSGERVRLHVRLASDRARVANHASEILSPASFAVSAASRSSVQLAHGGASRIVTWSADDVVVEATGLAGVVGTDGNGRAHATFECAQPRAVGAVALERGRRTSASWTKPDGAPLVITLVGHDGILRAHRSAVLDGVQRALTKLAELGRTYEHANLTVVLDASPTPRLATASTWCIVGVDAHYADSAGHWATPLARALVAITGAPSDELAARLVEQLVAPGLTPATHHALRELLATSAAAGSWSLRIPWLGRSAGLVDVVGWWSSPYQRPTPQHASLRGHADALEALLDELRAAAPDAWLSRMTERSRTSANASIAAATTTPQRRASEPSWTHRIDVQRTAGSALAPRLELFFADGLQHSEAWREPLDTWSIELRSDAPLVSASLENETIADAFSYDDARLAAPDAEPARALTGLATWWTQLSLWSWAAAF